MGSSTAMESAIISEGFRKSIEMHGLIYGKVIGDGDSSVYRKLISTSPYGPTFLIEKIECRNHLLRNYLNKLSDLAKDTTVSIALRKLISSDTLTRFRYAVTRAIAYRKQEDISLKEKQNLLKKDILNSPNHIFGEHSDCDKYFCKGDVTDKENSLPALKTSPLYDSIININRRLAENASSLLHDVDTNAAETFNSIIAKFVGGKRINFSLKGGYEIRCQAAAISYNTKGDFLWRLQEQLFGCSFQPQHLFRYREIKLKASKVTPNRRIPKRKSFAIRDEHYGDDTEHNLPNMDLDDYKKKAKEVLDELNTADRESICEETLHQSDSDKWKIERMKRITASNFGKICKLKRTTSTAKTVSALLYSSFEGTKSTKFGLPHETSAISLFEEQYKKKVKKCGLIVDKDHSFLACSPDGLVDDNAVIEIKSSEKSGYLTPEQAFQTKKIDYCLNKNGKWHLKDNHNYHYQVQGLLHITNRSICYFVIYTRGGIYVEEIQRDDTFWKDKMINRLSDFFMNSLLPELIDPRRRRNQSIREIYIS